MLFYHASEEIDTSKERGTGKERCEMNKINSGKFWEGIKKARKTRIICTAIFAVLAVIFAVIGFIVGNRNLGDPTDISKAPEVNAGEYVYLDVVDKLFMFIEGDYSSLHFVWDINEKLYVLDVLPSLARELQNATVDNPIRITGLTKEITGEIRDDAIARYNSFKNMDMEALTTSNFDDVVGSTYLYPRDELTNKWVFYVFGIIFLCFALPFAIASLFIERRIKRVVGNLSQKEADLISAEVEDDETIVFSKVQLFLTENYIISLGKSLDITKYTDIAWIYFTDMRQNGVLSSRHINIITYDGKDRFIPVIPYGKTRDAHLVIIDIIAGKNPEMLVGYTEENVSIMKSVKL